MPREKATPLRHEVTRWSDASGIAPVDLSPPLQTLALVRDYPVRLRCASLAWQALSAVLEATAIIPSTSQ
jgi:NifU-like protein involved in Fe-S cluster formation